MNSSVKVIVTLATIPLLPVILLVGAAVGAVVALEFLYLWLDFVWNDID